MIALKSSSILDDRVTTKYAQIRMIGVFLMNLVCAECPMDTDHVHSISQYKKMHSIVRKQILDWMKIFFVVCMLHNFCCCLNVAFLFVDFS